MTGRSAIPSIVTAGPPRATRPELAGTQNDGAAGWTACWPHEDLTAHCEEVTEYGDALRPLSDLLCDTRALRNGLAVAANQVGDRRRVFMWAWDGMDHVMANPVLSAFEGVHEWDEGCLSMNGVYVRVRRCERVHIDGFNIDGEPISADADGTLAMIFQHEVDHLNGLCILHRAVSRQVRRQAERTWAKRRRALGLDPPRP